MNPEETQDPSVDMEQSGSDGDMSDDDVAALLGFTTTLSEQMMNPPEAEGEVGDAETGDGTTTPKEIEEETPGTPNKDEEQDKEIADIRAALEKLLAEENDQSTENTETTG